MWLEERRSIEAFQTHLFAILKALCYSAMSAKKLTAF
jgi:hypothetical protein